MLSIAIAGLGRSGLYHHLRSTLAFPESYRVCGIFDIDPALTLSIGQRHGVKAFGSFEEMIRCRDVDLVVLATPSHLHYRQSIAALEHGKSVICEKPMATSLREAREIAALAAQTGRSYTVFHNSRYAGDFETIRQVLASGCLGEILVIKMHWNSFNRRSDWQSFQKYGGGVLLNIGPHAIDLCLQLLGLDARLLYSYQTSVFSHEETPDHAHLSLVGKGGAPRVELEVSNVDSYGQTRWHILGTDGGLHGSGIHLKWKHTQRLASHLQERSDNPLTDLRQGKAPEWTEFEWREKEDTKSLGFYQDYYRCQQSGTSPVSLSESLRVMELIDEASRSERLARPLAWRSHPEMALAGDPLKFGSSNR